MADRRFVLSADTARALRRMLDAERRGTEARPAATGRGLGLMPFDCKLKTDPESGKTRLMVCVSPSDALAGGNFGDSHVILVTESGREALPYYDANAVDAGWYDVGEISRGQSAYLIVCVSAVDYENEGEAAAFGTNVQRYYAIRTIPEAPQGMSRIASVPVVALCAWLETGLRQYQRGELILWSTRVDTIITRNLRSRYEPDTRSIETDGGAFRRLYGFQSPEIIDNPYQGSGSGPAPSDRNKILVLVRETNSAGDVAYLRYISLADFAAGTDGAPDVPDPPGLAELLEDKARRESYPCPTDGRGDVVYWNPCGFRWESLRDSPDGAAAALAGRFWNTGGDAETCYGTAIGNMNRETVIDLSDAGGAGPGRLIGDWQTGGALHALGGIKAGALATQALTEMAIRTDTGAELLIPGDNTNFPELAASSTVAALAARVAALESTLNRITATPLTFPDGTRVNVLTMST